MPEPFAVLCCCFFVFLYLLFCNLYLYSWETAYSNENENYDKHGLEGEVWFGEESMDRIIRWLERNTDRVPFSSNILDLGRWW